MSELAKDVDGSPLLLAPKAAGAGPGVDVPSESGNPAHVPAGTPGGGGGRFGKRGQPGVNSNAPPPPIPGQPKGVDPAEWARRMDAVRDAAREFEEFSEQDIREFLKGRTSRELVEGEIQSFLADVRSQQLDDLVDILDTNTRGVGRKRRFVKITAPRGYRRKTMGSLTDQELQSLARRLRARGWTPEQVSKAVPEQRRETIQGLSEEPGPTISW